MPDSAPKAIRLEDYRVPDFLIETVDLTFDLGDHGTTVTSRLAIRRNPAAERPAAPLVLDGQALELVSVAVDGEAWGANRYRVDEESLTLTDLPDTCTLELVTRIDPQTALADEYDVLGHGYNSPFKRTSARRTALWINGFARG